MIGHWIAASPGCRRVDRDVVVAAFRSRSRTIKGAGPLREHNPDRPMSGFPENRVQSTREIIK
jgi:hypothetical protein